MILKDVLKQGYPFVEAVASALPICDEFLISEGYSTDGTYEIVKKISNLNPKVKVFRSKWPDKKDPTVLADVTNDLRGKCKYEYILSIQANEIVHEQCAPTIKALPEIHPQVQTFSLPFLQFVNMFKVSDEFRLRFSKNQPQIIAIEDAWALGASKAFLRTKKLKAFANPSRLSAYLDKGISLVYANQCYDHLSRATYLPKPIFRYWSLFPKNFLEKCQRHADLMNWPEFRTSIDLLQSRLNDPENFWRSGADFLRQVQFKEKGLHYPEAFAYVEKKEHPAIIQEFISNVHTDQYYVREELFDLIKKL